MFRSKWTRNVRSGPLIPLAISPIERDEDSQVDLRTREGAPDTVFKLFETECPVPVCPKKYIV